ncbi:MAG: PAS domain-containing protein [Sandaracinaceae bacterium]|nr:PAS domain-containing protein [Sandaracinaceae bacterium]
MNDDLMSMEFSAQRGTDPLAIDALDDGALDELPYGVICIDAHGIILRYNIAEARFARLDRTAVIGRDFFTEVAPCTATPEFEGRVREVISQPPGRGVVAFNYVFDFKFGAQEVTIDVVASRDHQRFYLLVNRRTFLPMRSGPDARAHAPRLEELVSDEAGVLRDAREQRVVHAQQVLFDALLRTCDRVAPSTWEIFCREWGVMWGRRTVVDLETEWLERTGQSFRDQPMTVVAEEMVRVIQGQGWGAPTFDFTRATHGALRIRLDNSILAAAGRGTGRRCALLSGMLSAMFTHLASRRLVVEETHCTREGHPHCQFVVVGESRADRLRKLAATGADIDTVLRDLDVEETP